MFKPTHYLNQFNIDEFASSEGRDWTYIITGRVGPTGKTYLCNKLRENSNNVVEITEDMLPIVTYDAFKETYLGTENKESK